MTKIIYIKYYIKNGYGDFAGNIIKSQLTLLL